MSQSLPISWQQAFSCVKQELECGGERDPAHEKEQSEQADIYFTDESKVYELRLSIRTDDTKEVIRLMGEIQYLASHASIDELLTLAVKNKRLNVMPLFFEHGAANLNSLMSEWQHSDEEMMDTLALAMAPDHPQQIREWLSMYRLPRTAHHVEAHRRAEHGNQNAPATGSRLRRRP